MLSNRITKPGILGVVPSGLESTAARGPANASISASDKSAAGAKSESQLILLPRLGLPIKDAA
jgi:hypothetical protein